MRKVIFLGKSLANGRWIYGDYCITNNNDIETHYIIQIDSTDLEGFRFMVDSETVRMCSVFSDKNGDLISEGDIVIFGENIYQIVFERGSFCLYDRNGEMISKIGGTNDYYYSLFELSYRCCWENYSAHDIEVIGNIHDNPELLDD